MDSENENSRQPEAAGGSLYGDYISNPLMGDTATDWSPLHDAAIHGRLVSLRQLISQGHSANLQTMNRVSPLHEACLGGHTACVKYLLENGAKVNIATVDWNTPLYNACYSGSEACVNLLLQQGAEPLGGCTLASPIHEAVKRGYTKCMTTLLNHGVPVDCSVTHLGTPLYVACENHQMDCVRNLLSSGAAVNISKNFESPLHVATRNSDTQLVNLLLEHGADTDAKNAEGKRPVDLALPNSPLEKLLLQWEGPPSLKQLCRLCIGRYLGHSQPVTISKLPIPQQLKDFLCYR
ncbi:ankyrin repeat and SOCS box protein 9-like isoform X1 [Scyliorhinus canicula]|uniref:ankyrin repeat and SOCS box protein 9-like isoform X1 n=1 Tax=Scyliorhinus canicula TaxID=7830 RepID=UPI0018F729D9|nr:ankyrin repeat and SOCS box protein 9-like isoform X1 [Scyliorhinus canicula]XP_038658637.1 ankyrin repeat and SOCS box protein 9-like isoform X1 [Scyliorhinus canicula]XP_038658638.1 ankyrin repeat and SOCS box protein 9-like isoform X1 [Scyliorhinus canicula]XP_038658639.1 ankyrin repeat and SOCS box protein 9-like isoform X1 [Scyliorhinus canicula]XP_038658641.1 ankyrin repeat and SOCS box protein 9-like isoform X1 [Scyliorhinus canicula]XP_038658642.1 ankyrin repeat and SOCS box protein